MHSVITCLELYLKLIICTPKTMIYIYHFFHFRGTLTWDLCTTLVLSRNETETNVTTYFMLKKLKYLKEKKHTQALRLDLNIVYSVLLKPFSESINFNCHNINSQCCNNKNLMSRKIIETIETLYHGPDCVQWVLYTAIGVVLFQVLKAMRPSV